MGWSVQRSGPLDQEIFSLAKRVGGMLRERGQSIAVAESCTGGLLAGALTDVPGSSAYFLGAVVAYADRVKVEQLGVSKGVLATAGAVSAATAAAMAIGVRKRLQADIGVSITGVAGPDAEENKPAGLTFIAIASPEATTERYEWTGDRWGNRRNSVHAALGLLAQTLRL